MHVPTPPTSARRPLLQRRVSGEAGRQRRRGLSQDAPRAVRRVRAAASGCCSSSARSSRPCPTSRRGPSRCCCRSATHGQHGDLLRGDLREPDATVRARRQRAAHDDHQRRLVRAVVGGVSALGPGVDARDRGRTLPGARRQHRHQRLRRSLRRVLEQVESVRADAVLVQDLRFLTDRTIYSRIGDLVAWLSLAFTSRRCSRIRGDCGKHRSFQTSNFSHLQISDSAFLPMLQLDEQLRRYEDLARRASDLRSYL